MLGGAAAASAQPESEAVQRRAERLRAQQLLEARLPVLEVQAPQVLESPASPGETPLPQPRESSLSLRLCARPCTTQTRAVFVEHSGVLSAKATWRGNQAARLELFPPGASEPASITTGASPLHLTFTATDAHVGPDRPWRFRFSVADPVRVADLQAELSLELPGGGAQGTGGSPGGEAPVGEVITTVLADGSIEVRYPNGDARILHPGGNMTIIRDGQPLSLQLAQVPPPDPPLLELGGELDDLRLWLDALGERLRESVVFNVTPESKAQFEADLTQLDYYDQMLWSARVLGFLAAAGDAP